jgi:hypothetical protein
VAFPDCSRQTASIDVVAALLFVQDNQDAVTPFGTDPIAIQQVFDFLVYGFEKNYAKTGMLC